MDALWTRHGGERACGPVRELGDSSGLRLPVLREVAWRAAQVVLLVVERRDSDTREQV